MKKRTNYKVAANGYTYKLHYKTTALAVASTFGGVVENLRTGQNTHILPKGSCSCNVCGNELQGKKHCPLCNTLHYYN